MVPGSSRFPSRCWIQRVQEPGSGPVSHCPKRRCLTYNGSPQGTLGVFRSIGTLIFYKDERRWEVRARSDATAVDLATLIDLGLCAIALHGRKPGHWTRRRYFQHVTSKRTGKRIAFAPICYRLGADDLLGQSSVAAEFSDEEQNAFDLDVDADALGMVDSEPQ